MDTLLLASAAALLAILIVVLLVYFQNQQVRQLQGIYDRLGRMKTPPKPRDDPEALRQERASHVGALVMLEADLNRTGRDATPEELNGVDAARAAIKALNERIVTADDWRGPPFDLEWSEIFEQMPATKRQFLAAELDQGDQRK